MRHYEKHWTNPEHTDFRIVEIYDDGTRQTVSSDQDEFLRWLATGNAPAEFEYAPPPAEPEVLAVPDTLAAVREHIVALRDFCVRNPDQALPVVEALAAQIVGGGA